MISNSVRPGALFVPSADVDEHQLSQAQEQGAYGAIVPHALRGQTDDIQIPLIYAEPTMGQLGKLVSDMAGSPSDSHWLYSPSRGRTGRSWNPK